MKFKDVSLHFLKLLIELFEDLRCYVFLHYYVCGTDFVMIVDSVGILE